MVVKEKVALELLTAMEGNTPELVAMAEENTLELVMVK